MRRIFHNHVKIDLTYDAAGYPARPIQRKVTTICNLPVPAGGFTLLMKFRFELRFHDVAAYLPSEHYQEAAEMIPKEYGLR